jgi:formamidopyrimidine-DNA glycosylase
MPELPEVETIARQLNVVLPGKTIKSVEVLREKSIVGLRERLIDQAIKHVGRRAKMIVIELDSLQGTVNSEQPVILIHLKMTGQLIYQPKAFTPGVKAAYTPGVVNSRIVGGHPTADWVNQLPSKHTRVIIKFTDGSTLFFNDQRVFGWVKIATRDSWLAIREKLPPDVVDKEFTVEYLTKVLKKSTRAVKLILLDQSKMGGMGNIYVNDALWEAGTKPTRRGSTLKTREINRLHRAMLEVIKNGIAAGGASESTYKHIDGLGGHYQDETRVYKREGQPCLRGDGGIIKKIKLGGRGTQFCPVCQK